MCKNSKTGCGCHLKDVNVIKTYSFPVAGAAGQNGANGLTPYIGNNGNWWIGNTDTGVKAGANEIKANQGLHVSEDGFVQLGGEFNNPVNIYSDNSSIVLGNAGIINIQNHGDNSFTGLFLLPLGSGIELRKADYPNTNENIESISIDDFGFRITDSKNNKGIVYSDDYSTNWTDNSLITKKWALDTFAPIGGGGSSYTFENGITNSDGLVGLKGDAEWASTNEDTVIRLQNYGYSVTSTNNNGYSQLSTGYTFNGDNPTAQIRVETANGNDIQLTLLTDNISGEPLAFLADNIREKGLYYPSDYSANWTEADDNVLVNKGYVDNLVGNLPTAPVTSVNGRVGAVTGLAEFSDLGNYVPLSTVGRGVNQIVRRDPNGDVVSGRLIIAGQDGGATDSTNSAAALQVNGAFDVENTSRSIRVQLGDDGDLVLRTFSGTAGIGFWADGLRVRNIDQRIVLSAPLSASVESTPQILTRNQTTGLIEYVTSSGGGSATTDASQLTSGTLNDARLTNNVVLRNSPVLLGVPTAPTAANGTNTNQLATTAFVLANAGITLTTNGTTGASTFNTTTRVLNIPNYSGVTPTQAAALGYVDVTTLGISSTTHTTDDKAILQGILDQGYVKLYIPANCTINLSDTIYAYGNTDILGAGQSKSIIRALNWVGGTEHGLIEFNGVSNIKFEGIKFTGNVVQMKAALVLNPFPNSNKNVKVYNCVFQDLWSHGILFGSGDSTTQWYEQIDIAQNYFNRLMDVAHPDIPDEDIINLKCVGVWLGSHTKKATIHHNFFEDQSGDAVHAFGTTPATGNVPLDPEWRRLDISHNYIYKTWMGIELNGNYGTANGSNISHNIIIHPRRPNAAGFGISFAGDHSKVNDNIVVVTEMSGYEVFGNNNQFHNNQLRFSLFKPGSGGNSMPNFNSGVISPCGLEVYGSNVSIKNNVFNFDVLKADGTPTDRQITGIFVVGKSIDNISPPSFEGTSDYAIGYDIQGNHLHGCTKSFVEATRDPIRKVHIHNNQFTSKYLLNSAIWLQGFDWVINNNHFDLDGSSNGYTDGLGAVMVHNMGTTNTRSLVFGNTIRNESWFFPTLTRGQYKYWQNQFINSSTYVGWTDYLHFPVTAAERAAISVKIGTQQTVTQTDGGAAAGTYNYVNGAWVKL